MYGYRGLQEREYINNVKINKCYFIFVKLLLDQRNNNCGIYNWITIIMQFSLFILKM